MITIDYDEALHLYEACEAFQRDAGVAENSPLRIKTRDIFQKNTGPQILHMEIVCGMVYRTLAQYYMEQRENQKGEAF